MFTEWTNEFLGSYSNYTCIFSHSIFNRMALCMTLCLPSNIKENLRLSAKSFLPTGRGDRVHFFGFAVWPRCQRAPQARSSVGLQVLRHARVEPNATCRPRCSLRQDSFASRCFHAKAMVLDYWTICKRLTYGDVSCSSVVH